MLYLSIPSRPIILRDAGKVGSVDLAETKICNIQRPLSGAFASESKGVRSIHSGDFVLAESGNLVRDKAPVLAGVSDRVKSHGRQATVLST